MTTRGGNLFPGRDDERVAPAQCDRCGGLEFERKGRVGLWDGFPIGGCIYEAVCLSCNAVWQSRSNPFVCRDDPMNLRWRLER